LTGVGPEPDWTGFLSCFRDATNEAGATEMTQLAHVGEMLAMHFVRQARFENKLRQRCP